MTSLERVTLFRLAAALSIAEFTQRKPIMPQISDYERDLNTAMEAHATCGHEDVELHCPFGCSGTVDEDTRVCPGCHEGVDPVRVCIHCEEELGTLGEHEHATR